MWDLFDGIRAVDEEHGLGIQLRSAADRDRLRQRIASRSAQDGRWTWEAEGACTSIQGGEAWSWIAEFVGAHPCVLLFDAAQEVEMLAVPSGRALHTLPANSHGFEFYVTDVAAGYLICFNHHDMLVCWGRAGAWLERRPSPRDLG